MPGTVVLEDDGYFILASYFNAVTHPPGYPLFTFIGHLFTRIPVGSVALRVHMASACCGALACVALWVLIHRLLKDRLCAYVAALGLGFSRVFWSQAIIAEVYTLNVLLYISMLFLVMNANIVPRDKKDTHFKWLAFIYGISLSNHWPLIFLSTPALLILLWPERKFVMRRFFSYLPFLMAGLIPYAWLIWRSHIVPELSFYGPINSWQEFWLFVSRKLYANVDFSQTAGLLDKLQFAGFTMSQTVDQFGIIGTLFSVAGLIWLWRSRHSLLFWGMIVAFLSNTFLLILLLGFDFDYFHRAIFMVYPLIAYVMVAIWMACGLKYTFELVAMIRGKWGGAGLIAPVLALFVIASILIANIPHNFRKHDLLASDFARLVLESLEPNAIFYSNSDNFDGPIGYLNKIEKVRTDVTVYTGRYLVSDNKLYRPYQLHLKELNKLVNHVIQSTDRPVYYTSDFPNNYAQERFGLYTKVNKEDVATFRERIILEPAFIAFFKRWDQKHIFTNSWDTMHYNLVMADLCETILLAEYSNDKNTNIMLHRQADLICNNYQGMLNKLKYALQDSASSDFALEKMLKKAEEYKDQAFTKEEGSRFGYYQGLYYLRVGNQKQAKRSFAVSFAAWPHPDNPSKIILSGFRQK